MVQETGVQSQVKLYKKKKKKKIVLDASLLNNQHYEVNIQKVKRSNPGNEETVPYTSV